MADPQAAQATQLNNIQARTGQSLAQLRALVAGSALVKHAEIRSWLMQTLGLGYGDANLVATLSRQAPSAPLEADPLDAIYSGKKAHLRVLHDHVLAQIDAFGPHEKAPKKANVSLRRARQFALIGPATVALLEIGLNHKDLPAHPRLKVMPAGSMCNCTVRLGSVEEVDADLLGWLRAAYDAAG